jgi:hypothetical protein
MTDHVSLLGEYIAYICRTANQCGNDECSSLEDGCCPHIERSHLCDYWLPPEEWSVGIPSEANRIQRLRGLRYTYLRK